MIVYSLFSPVLKKWGMSFRAGELFDQLHSH